jgi:poly-beta-hydroxyalkanoate depolymerase
VTDWPAGTNATLGQPSVAARASRFITAPPRRHPSEGDVNAVSDVARTWLENPINALLYTAAGRTLAASAKIFERLTRRYGKPAFDLATTVVGGKIVPIVEVVV